MHSPHVFLSLVDLKTFGCLFFAVIKNIFFAVYILCSFCIKSIITVQFAVRKCNRIQSRKLSFKVVRQLFNLKLSFILRIKVNVKHHESVWFLFLAQHIIFPVLSTDKKISILCTAAHPQLQPFLRFFRHEKINDGKTIFGLCNA